MSVRQSSLFERQPTKEFKFFLQQKIAFAGLGVKMGRNYISSKEKNSWYKLKMGTKSWNWHM